MQIVKPKVYIESTVPSFYFETRTEPEMVARRNWTRRWWDQKRQDFELVTSEAVILELERGDYPARADARALIADLPLLGITDPIRDIVHAYIRNMIMPKDPGGDSLHLALAAYHKCDFLLTWNCAHLANANKFPHIRQLHGKMGLYNPALVTPMEFLEEEVQP